MGVKVALTALLANSPGLLVASLATPEKLVRVRSARHEARASPGIPFFDEGSLSGLGLSSACETALYGEVNCDPNCASLITEDYAGSFDNETVTALVCDAGCGTSVGKLHDAVLSSCGETAEWVPGMSYLDFVDRFWSNWNQSFLTDPDSGQNCNDYIASWPEVDDISEIPREDVCSYCNVQRLAMMQADAYTNTYEENFESMYRYTASECQLTVSNFNATPSVFNVTVNESGPPICISDTYYTAEQGDTCDSIASSQGVSAATLFHINSNILNCTSIIADTKLCLPLACNSLYAVQPDDDCSGIAADSGILTRELLSYNSQLNWNCSNLHATNPFWGTVLCVTTPGGTYQGQAPNTTAPSTDEVVDPPAGATVAKGSNLDCGQWYVNDGSLQCVQICLEFVISINSLTTINPSLGKESCDQDLVVGDAYCVKPVGGWADGMTTSAATATATATPPPSSSSSGATSTVTKTSSNSSPTTGKTTTTTPSTIAIPSPTEPGTIASCTKWHLVQSGDTCEAIYEGSSVSADDFYAWNPQVGSACTGLWLGYYVCVGTSTSTSTSKPTSQTTSPTAAAPTPTEPGTIASCTKWHLVQSGDTCYSICQGSAVPADEFYSWNPQVGSDCSGLWLNYYVCVGTSSTSTGSQPTTPTVAIPSPTEPGTISSCKKWHLVASQDSCASICQQYAIDTTNFYKWNTQVGGSACTGLWLGYYVCVGV